MHAIENGVSRFVSDDIVGKARIYEASRNVVSNIGGIRFDKLYISASWPRLQFFPPDFHHNFVCRRSIQTRREAGIYCVSAKPAKGRARNANVAFAPGRRRREDLRRRSLDGRIEYC